MTARRVRRRTTSLQGRVGVRMLLRDPNTLRWVVAGAFAGLAMLSKYHGVFVLAGTGLFLLTSAPHRKWFARPGPYLGALVAFAMFTPVLLWNREHGWVSFAFQFGRAEGARGLHLGAMLANIAGQAGYVLPWIWVPLVVVLWNALRTGTRDAARWSWCASASGRSPDSRWSPCAGAVSRTGRRPDT